MGNLKYVLTAMLVAGVLSAPHVWAVSSCPINTRLARRTHVCTGLYLNQSAIVAAQYGSDNTCLVQCRCYFRTLPQRCPELAAGESPCERTRDTADRLGVPFGAEPKSWCSDLSKRTGGNICDSACEALNPPTDYENQFSCCYAVDPNGG